MKTLRDIYKSFAEKYEIEADLNEGKVTKIILDSIVGFMNCHKNVALYCYGEHTKKLFHDFVYELKDVKFIVDNGNLKENQGYVVIKDDQIEENEIDGIIISSYRYREEIKKGLADRHNGIDYLDPYDEVKKNGINIDREYYLLNSPYLLYAEINDYRRKAKTAESLIELVKRYIIIKDFRLAMSVLDELIEMTEEDKYATMMADVENMQRELLNRLENVTEDTILLLCVDGLKREMISQEGLGKTYSVLKDKARIYTNAYSYSNGTFESLVPALSENTDQRTHYMDDNGVDEDNCRFVKEAIAQGYHIYVIGDGYHYISGEHTDIDYGQTTLTQKIWRFVELAEKDPKGLFYVQPLYESHYSFPNPYCENEIILNGMSILHDYMEGEGKIPDRRYYEQFVSAMKYLDDTLCIFFERLKCRTFIFADHGELDYDLLTRIEPKNLKSIMRSSSETIIRIPMMIIAPECDVYEEGRLMSLMDMNDIVCSLIEKKRYATPEHDHVKIGRTALYNPINKYVYETYFDLKRNILAFEGFIFSDGYKIVVYSDGCSELFHTEDDSLCDDMDKKKYYLRRIRNEVSVCEI